MVMGRCVVTQGRGRDTREIMQGRGGNVERKSRSRVINGLVNKESIFLRENKFIFSRRNILHLVTAIITISMSKIQCIEVIHTVIFGMVKFEIFYISAYHFGSMPMCHVFMGFQLVISFSNTKTS